MRVGVRFRVEIRVTIHPNLKRAQTKGKKPGRCWLRAYLDDLTSKIWYGSGVRKVRVRISIRAEIRVTFQSNTLFIQQ